MGSKIRRTGKPGHMERHKKNLQTTEPGVKRHSDEQNCKTASKSSRSSSHDGNGSSSAPNPEVPISSALTQRSSQQSDETKFRFADLPRDIALYMLEFMLIAPEGIVNPWMKRDELENDYPRRTNAYTWRKWLRPSILATCRTFYEIGTPILYKRNTFRFIHPPPLVHSSEDSCAKSMWDMANFVDYNHVIFDHRKGNSTGAKSKVFRNELIKHLQIQRSEFEDDVLASQGVSRVTSNYWSGQPHTFFMLAIFSTAKLDLKTLTLTLDEEDEAMLECIEAATEIYKEPLATTWNMVPLRMKVQTLIIRGAGPLERQNEINPFTKRVMDWITATGLEAEKVVFSGPFMERRIMEDGFVIFEGENWRAINTPLPEMSQEEILELLDRTWASRVLNWLLKRLMAMLF